MSDLLLTAEDRAEFGEKSVEKLEKTIDQLDEGLFFEKTEYQKLSAKIDIMLNNMVEMHGMNKKDDTAED